MARFTSVASSIEQDSRINEDNTRTACSGCGLSIEDGNEGCYAFFQQFFLDHNMPLHVGIGRLAFDTYCVQHPDRLCVSAKSLAAHLGGICWGLEHDGVARGYEEYRRSLDGTVRFTKPALPTQRGPMTIADVVAADAAARAETIRAWAQTTWQAHTDLHRWARQRVADASS